MNFRGYRDEGHTLLRTPESYPPCDHDSLRGGSRGFHGGLYLVFRRLASSGSDPRIFSGFGTPDEVEGRSP